MSSSLGRSSLNSYPPSNSHSEQIKHEIQRFESVHPCIYQMYDLIDYIQDMNLQAQLRDQVLAIEDAFVNSHEWTLARTVSELHLGIIGSAHSGKTALVHRYLTGSYQSEESPEGGRFKKEVFVENQSHILLIRDEGNGYPDAQFTHWTDAVIFVFAVDSYDSFEKIPHFVEQMSRIRNINEMPLIIVGTKDSVSENSPRVVTEDQGKKMAGRLGHRCSYFETHSPYGTNVERVFKEACTKIFQQRLRASFGASRTPTPNPKEKYSDSGMATIYGAPKNNVYYNHHRTSSSVVPTQSLDSQARKSQQFNMYSRDGVNSARGAPDRGFAFAAQQAPHANAAYASRVSQHDYRGISPSSSQKSIASMNNGRSYSTTIIDGAEVGSAPDGATQPHYSTSQLPQHTPQSTPTTQRKNRRISNIFKKEHHEEKAAREVNMGIGRAIPVMQGQLYKRSGKGALNRDWKKKFVTLTNDGKLTYHQNIKEYMENGAGKEVFLGTATVRIPGRQRTRNSQVVTPGQPDKEGSAERNNSDPRRSDAGVVGSGEGTSGGGSDDGTTPSLTTSSHSTIPATPQTVANSKKRRGHTRKLTGGAKGGDVEDEECFEIITCDQKRWEFCASSAEDREQWVKAIEGQIDAAIQKQLSQPSNQQRILGCKAEVQAIIDMPGNERCADCACDRPEWASLNLGTLICMECSGVHRNLGSHISKVRSLKFDDWPVEYLAVMRAIGNETANQIWEKNAPRDSKPRADASPEEREAYIRQKYVAKKFLAGVSGDLSIGGQLIQAVLSRDVPTISLLLTKATPSDVNATVSSTDRRTALHLACSNACVEIVQLLVWNNADLRGLDEQGRSALWHAHNSDAKECVSVLVGAGLPPDYGLTAHPATPTSNQSMENTVIANGTSNLGEAIMGSLSNRDFRRMPQAAFDRLPASNI